MDQNLIISLVTVVVSAISSLALVNWRLGQLETKVDKHNSYGDKIANIDTSLAVMKNDISYIKEKLDK